MSKILFILTFLVTSIALAESAKPIECSTSNGKVRFEGIETQVNEDGNDRYHYHGEFFLASPRSDRNYVIGEISRSVGFVEEQAFLTTANILIVDATECQDSQSGQHCTLVSRATTSMLCSYLLEKN